MKTCVLPIAAMTVLCSLCHAQPSATLLWETGAQLKAPQSAGFDSARAAIYVSNLGAGTDAKAGGGFLSALDTAGAVVSAEWVKGFRAPRGLAVSGERLYVADVTDLVEVEIAGGSVKVRYPAPEAQSLTDVAVDRNGAVYVTDQGPKNSAIYRLFGGRLTVWIRQAQIVRPRGICAADGRIVVGLHESGAIYSIALTRDLKQIGQVSAGIEGIAGDGGKGYVVSTRAGYVIHLSHDEGETPLVDFSDKGGAPPDLEYVPSRRMLLVPRPAGNTVAAYAVTF